MEAVIIANMSVDFLFFSLLAVIRRGFALHRLPLYPQVNNATARVMTNKKMVSPYPNGEALSTLPYGNSEAHKPSLKPRGNVQVESWSVMNYRFVLVDGK